MDAGGSGGIVHAWLAAGDEYAQFFVADVLQMLHAKAEREGVRVSGMDADVSEPRLTNHCFLGVGGPLVARLADEVGLHRAQFVPRNSSTGRVETAIVAVEFLKEGQQPGTGRPRWPIVKTYNYMLSSCIRHVTGQVSSLHDALLGKV